jgi:hypothetical protein
MMWHIKSNTVKASPQHRNLHIALQGKNVCPKIAHDSDESIGNVTRIHQKGLSQDKEENVNTLNDSKGLD